MPSTNTQQQTKSARLARQLMRQRRLAEDLEHEGWFVAPPAKHIDHPRLFPAWSDSAEKVREALDEWNESHA